VAVIVAEEITGRFLNVISLFNGFIPLVAIQMQAFKFGDEVSLIFTTVLDQMKLGLVDDDEPFTEATDLAYWERRGTKATLEMTDKLLSIVRELDPNLSLKYNMLTTKIVKWPETTGPGLVPADGSSVGSCYDTFRSSVTRPVGTHSTTKMLPEESKQASWGWMKRPGRKRVASRRSFMPSERTSLVQDSS
jgi:hypothetical protein